MEIKNIETIIAAIIGGFAAIVAAFIKVCGGKRRKEESSRPSKIVVFSQYKTGSTSLQWTKSAHKNYPEYSAPASVFLSGEHSVMFGHTAVYLPLPLRLHLRIKPDPARVGVAFDRFLVSDPSNPNRIKQIGDLDCYETKIGLEQQKKLDELFQSLILPTVSFRGKKGVGFGFEVLSEFPVACGLDASGAISACLAQGFADHFMDLKEFRDKIDLQEYNDQRIVELLAWLIENCFHDNSGSGAGARAAIMGRQGRHPLIYFSPRRSRLKQRKNIGYGPINVGSEMDAINELVKLEPFVFDPQEPSEEHPTYPAPPDYHISLVFSGKISRTGTVLADGAWREVRPDIKGRVKSIQDGLKLSIGLENLSRSVRLHAEEFIDNIYLNDNIKGAEKDIELDNGFHELLCDGMGGVSILMMNSILGTWDAAPTLMNTYQSLLNAARFSSHEIERLLASVSSRSVKLERKIGVGAKLTGCGRGGDIVILSLKRDESVSDEKFAKYHRSIVSSCRGEKVTIHFDSTRFNAEALRRVDGVRRE